MFGKITKTIIEYFDGVENDISESKTQTGQAVTHSEEFVKSKKDYKRTLSERIGDARNDEKKALIEEINNYEKSNNNTSIDNGSFIKNIDFKTISFGLIIFLFFVFVIKSCLSPDDLEKFDSEPFIISQHFVKDRLKSPRSANFPSFDYDSKYLGNGKFPVESYVDAKNIFGAEIRTPYLAILKFNVGDWGNPGNWTLESLTIN